MAGAARARPVPWWGRGGHTNAESLSVAGEQMNDHSHFKGSTAALLLSHYAHFKTILNVQLHLYIQP